MTKHLVFILSSLLISNVVFSQLNPKIDKRKFFNLENGRPVAEANLKKAEDFYHQSEYNIAMMYYEKVYGYNSSDPALNFKMGVCHLYGTSRKKALKYLIQSSPEISELYYLMLGRAYQYTNQFERAKDAYGKFYESLSAQKKRKYKQQITQLINDCDTSIGLVKDSLSVLIKNLGFGINTKYDDYGAVYTPSNIFFTSNRPVQYTTSHASKKSKENIYVSKLLKNAINIPTKGLNSHANTSVAGYDPDKGTLFIYKGKRQNGNIYITTFDTTWHKQKVKRINSFVSQETTIAVDKSGNIFFVSDRNGGYGGKDIWFSQHKGNNSYLKPVNLGDVINTPEDEECVFVTPDGNTLYFSSKGHPGMGGFDIFKSIKDNTGQWTAPRNIGYPINTPSDDVFFRTTDSIAVYSTIKEDSFGGLDIYKVYLNKKDSSSVKQDLSKKSH